MSCAAPHRAAPAEAPSSSCDLADVFRRYGGAYQCAHPLTTSQRKAMRDILACRTAALGGHRLWCPACGYQRYVYHSCRNRHCPQCQSMATAAWVHAREDELLPVPYFHNVFTLPHELNPLALYSERNRRLLWGLLLDAAAETLLKFGRQELGGKIGFTLVLHTWDQQLRPHFHVHALIPAGALSKDGKQWVAGGKKFLFPVHGLSKVFRAKYIEGLAQLLRDNALDIPLQLALDLPLWRWAWLRGLRQKSWVVYSQPPFAGPKKLLNYLARYTHRVAISNDRILSCEAGQVRFTWRDRGDGDRLKEMSLPGEEFLHRFLSHVVPSRFLRIRHYGLLANRGKKQRLAHIRQLLGVRIREPQQVPPRTAAEWVQALLGVDVNRCPCCGEQLYCERISPPQDDVRPAREPSKSFRERFQEWWDSS